MSDLLKKIEDTTNRILELQKERAAREASANAHEKAAREDRMAMTQCKDEMAVLNTVLRDAGVQQAVNTAQQAAQQAQADAEASKTEAATVLKQQSEALARLEEKEKQLDALLAKAAEPTE